MGLRIAQVDAFAAGPFTGNPAAVCLLDAPAESRWMQNVALEMNLSETAFLLREGDGYRLRWFTPVTEVALCGHATLASAHLLWEEGYIAPQQRVAFSTLSGPLSAVLEGELICMDFPASPVRSVDPADLPGGLVEALGCRPLFVGRSDFDYLVEVGSEEELGGMSPAMDRLARINTRGTIVTAPSDQYDFVSRFFAPALGVSEDPVTGSAHCALAPYWAKKLGRTELRAFQASRRGGIVATLLSGDRVILKGEAVTTLRGELCV